MCPFRYLYHVLLFLVSNVLLASCVDWKAAFNPTDVRIKTASKARVNLVLSGLTSDAIASLNDQYSVKLRSEDDEIATIKAQELRFFEIGDRTGSYDANFDVDGVFLGEWKRHNSYHEEC